MVMTIELPALERTDATVSPAPYTRLRRFARPALGLLLPVGLALAWEIMVWLGLSNGRLVPPP
jgi:sulfonate transport system permease protein